MRFLLGSCYWKMNTEDSDKDYRDYIFPSNDRLFNAEIVSIQRLETIDGEKCDIELKDVRLILKELKKGSLKTFEVFYNRPLDELDVREKELWDFIEDNRDKLFEEVKYEFMCSVLGEGISRLDKLDNKLDGKQIAHLQKLLWLLTLSYNCGNPFHIILSDIFTDKLLQTRLNPTEDLLSGIKSGFDFFKRIDLKRYRIEDKPTLRELEGLIFDLIFFR